MSFQSPTRMAALILLSNAAPGRMLPDGLVIGSMLCRSSVRGDSVEDELEGKHYYRLCYDYILYMRLTETQIMKSMLCKSSVRGAIAEEVLKGMEQ